MNVFFADEQDDPLPAEQLRSLAAIILDSEGLSEGTEVTILAVGDQQMAEYNQRFMGREGPTDVLAFPLEQLQPGHPPLVEPHGPPVNLGDVIIAPNYVRQQALSRRVAYEDELALMVTHGILHLLGYDHKDDEEAHAMEKREAELLALVGRSRP